MKIAIILGTRPEIIKLSPIIRYCANNQLDYFIIHTNQHYSDNMDKIFFKELGLVEPQYNLGIGSGEHGAQTGKMLVAIEKVLLAAKPDLVLVQGDTNTVLAGALAAAKLQIKVGHVEAGLRSYDRTMPEELNRIVADHIADWLFCPTDQQAKILLGEGIAKEKIFITGNTIVDAILHSIKNINHDLLSRLNLKEKQYILLTMHRPSNVDEKDALAKQLTNISRLAEDKGLEVVFPIHPRTLKNIKAFALNIPDNIKVIEPLSFIDLLTLEKFAKIILTDSGGLQEEGCILGVPTLNLRDNTERPECVEVGASKIVGSDYNKLSDGFNFYDRADNIKWLNPFGDGHSTAKIIKICQSQLL